MHTPFYDDCSATLETNEKHDLDIGEVWLLLYLLHPFQCHWNLTIKEITTASFISPKQNICRKRTLGEAGLSSGSSWLATPDLSSWIIPGSLEAKEPGGEYKGTEAAFRKLVRLFICWVRLSCFSSLSKNLLILFSYQMQSNFQIKKAYLIKTQISSQNILILNRDSCNERKSTEANFLSCSIAN